MFAKNYETVKNSPPPTAWPEYEAIVRAELAELLAKYEGESPPRDERPAQELLERHPCLVPGAFTPGSASGHYPFPMAVISQPPLPGCPRKTPDFMWIAKDSATLCPMLVELERPNKKWFTNKNEVTADFSQAQQQLATWKAWFNYPEHVELFYRLYQIPSDYRDHLALRPHCILIYGRRREANSHPERRRVRGQLARNDETLMTYDRLVPDANTRYFLTAQIKDEKYHAVSIPPTVVLGPTEANHFWLIEDKESAAMDSYYLTPDRRDFLIKRFSYWDGKGREGISFYRTGDSE